MESICPLDGRYADKIKDVTECFGEFALAKNKVEIEVKYFTWFNYMINDVYKAASGVNEFEIYNNFTIDDYNEILAIERKTNHDIKAIQIFVQNKLKSMGCPAPRIETVHWGLTSQDIVNTSYYMAAKKYISGPLVGHIEKLTDSIKQFVDADVSEMVAYTHGQPAIKTTFGRELAVYLYRIDNALKHVDLSEPDLRCKIGGAIGSLAGHKSIYPAINWDEEMSTFCIDAFGLSRCELSTQVENYQSLCSFLDILRNITNILVDLCRDMWLYSFNDTIKLKYVDGETGSSTMTHKINPIKFENAEGNFELCNTLIEFMTRKLAKSRLQRDLSDSTVIRNIGMVFGYFSLAMQSLTSGMNTISVNTIKLENDVRSTGKIYTEYVQLYLKSVSYSGVDDIVSTVFRNNETCDVFEYCDKLKRLGDYGIAPDHIETMIENILTPGFYRGGDTVI